MATVAELEPPTVAAITDFARLGPMNAAAMTQPP
jgi:hypothetical protein